MKRKFFTVIISSFLTFLTLMFFISCSETTSNETQYTSKGSFIVNVTNEDESYIYEDKVALVSTLAEFIKTSLVKQKTAELYKEKYNEDIPPYTINTSITGKNFIIDVTCTSKTKSTQRILDTLMEASIYSANSLKDQDGEVSVLYDKLLIFEQASSAQPILNVRN